MDNINYLRELFGSEDLVKRFVDLFIKDTPALLSKMNDCLEQGDFESLSTYAHSLKSQLSYFNAVKASETAKKIEVLGESGDMELLKTLFEKLKSQVEKLMQDLTSII